DPRGRQLEENFFAGNQPYDEQSLIPHVEGVDSSMAGEPKLNLNRLLEEDPDEAVTEIKEHIRSALPEFAALRRGGFPEDYEATLAASMIDYADRDSKPTVKEGEYRGIDSCPLVNEFLLTITWRWLNHSGDFDAGDTFPWSNKSFFRENGRLYVLFTVELFAELWNMSPLPIEGDYQFNYETHYSFPYGSNPEISFMDEEVLDRPVAAIDPNDEQSGSHHNLAKDGNDGRYYFPPVSISLDGNEHRVVRLGSVRYKIDVAPAVAFLPGQIDTLSGDDGQSSYVMRWNGERADWSRGGLERLDINRLRNGDHPETRANISGGSFGEYGGFYNGMGDVRMCYYAETMQSANSYPQNYSPNRRNVRYGSIYSRNPNTIYGRVLPSEWPDGGHDADFGERAYRQNRSTDRSRRPDDARFLVPHPGSEPEKAPVRISNFGRYYSETELGRIFDPAMWAKRSSRPAIQQWTEAVEIRGVEESGTLGGGNSLRIGRPEHPGFSGPGRLRPGIHAARLLDLFHCGKPFSEDAGERQGGVVTIRGHVNINTASRDTLRALAAGPLAADPLVAVELRGHDTSGSLAPRVIPTALSAPKSEVEADILADAIIAGRPYASASQLAEVTNEAGEVVFGNEQFYPKSSSIQWSDAAAEEVFARVYNSATTRSRNFRVFTIGQAVRDLGNGEVKVLSTRRKMFQVFADPGGRDEAGALQPDELDVRVLYERDL
ncbi:MAG: hypothetical protein HKO57_14670, partial [Akkermansiaceae bacterium]|nr:hypothetical protein [Akkermansiaceae bacterium]